MRHWVVVPQIALSLVLLLVAGVHVRSLMRIEMADVGYRADNAILLQVRRWEPPISRVQLNRMTGDERRRATEEEAAKTRTFNRAILAKLDGIRDLGAFGLASSLPVRTSQGQPRIVAPDAGGPGQPETAAVSTSIVSAGYFAAMGMTIRQGRTFDARDTREGVQVAVISASLARKLWPAGNAIGHAVSYLTEGTSPPSWLQIVGVVNDVEPVLHDAHDQPHVYESLLQQWRPWAPFLIVRTPGQPHDDPLPTLRRSVVDADAFSEVTRVQTMRQLVGEVLYPRRVAAGILLAAGLIGLGLACIGLYGVVSYSVAQRLREIGIRATLGADRHDIISLVLREGLLVLGLGTVAGLALSVSALKLTAGLIPGVPLADGLTFVVVPFALGLVVLVACYVPARRAAHVDPIQVLRTV
jgi:predicted permease